jgi:2-polyprenyl-6-methoxyphenol hydroxylase-like FAD-dependent oxidoreductase
VVYEASFLKYHETEGGVVALFEGLAYPLRCRLLLGADGPFSGVRAQCVQDSEPAYDVSVP